VSFYRHARLRGHDKLEKNSPTPEFKSEALSANFIIL
jgi:hypothetical protein